MNQFSEKVSSIRSVADLPRGPYKLHYTSKLDFQKRKGEPGKMAAHLKQLQERIIKALPSRHLKQIEAAIEALEKNIVTLLREVVG